MTILGLLTKGVTDPDELFNETVDWIVTLKNIAIDGKLNQAINSDEKKQIIEIAAIAKGDLKAMTTDRYREDLIEALLNKEVRRTENQIERERIKPLIEEYAVRIVYIAQVMARAFVAMRKEMQEDRIVTYNEFLEEIKTSLVFPFIQLLQPEAPKTARHLTKLAA